MVLSGCGSDGVSDAVDQIYLSEPNNLVNVLLKINKDEFDAINEGRKKESTIGRPLTIQSATREKDILKLVVNYSGGCSSHSFTVLWDGIVYTDPPCFMNLLILHYSDDNCEASITETIEINLKDLVGDVSYKDDCAYMLYTSFNTTDKPDQEVKGIN